YVPAPNGPLMMRSSVNAAINFFLSGTQSIITRANESIFSDTLVTHITYGLFQFRMNIGVNSRLRDWPPLVMLLDRIACYLPNAVFPHPIDQPTHPYQRSSAGLLGNQLTGTLVKNKVFRHIRRID